MSIDQQALYDARLELVDFLVDALYDVPDPEFVGRLLDGGLETPEESVNDDLDRGFEHLREFAAERDGDDPEAVADDLNVEYTRLFVGPRPPVQPHETYFREDTDFLSKGLAEVEASYSAAGWGAHDELSEEGDFVGVELAFLRDLLDRQRAGEEEAVGYERVFLDEHLTEWVEEFAAAVEEETENQFYLAAVDVLRGFVAFERDLVA